MQNFVPQYNQYRAPQYSVPQNYYGQNITPQPQIQFKMVPATNRNEADATIPDVNGAPSFFFNRGTNEIYLKQMDMQPGISIFKEYVEKPVTQTPVSSSISIDTLNEKLDSIKAILEHAGTVTEEVKKAKKND